MNIGIESISFYSSHYFLDLKTLAKARDTDPSKYYEGIGQEKMAVPPPGEDIITLAANASKQALQGVDSDKIEAILFATESSVDQSKAGGIYIHSLLDLQPNCRIVELKQACYSATASLHFARDMIASHPGRKVLVIATDIARYGLGAAGEVTQGAGAVAMVISADPKIMLIEAESGYFTDDVMDFWRPNYREEALVDGKYSVRIYLKTLAESWKQYQERAKRELQDFEKFCYHLPFTRMAEKAHKHLLKINQAPCSEEIINSQIGEGLIYNRIVGNVYAGSLYLGLISLLENSKTNLDGKKISLFSYGSGCVGELFSGQVTPGYKNHLQKAVHASILNDRQELEYDQYAHFYNFETVQDGSTQEIPVYNTGAFRLARMENHKRIYEPVS